MKKFRSLVNGTKIPIYFISSSLFNDELKIKVRESGADGFITKPYKIDEILSLLKKKLNLEYEYLTESVSLNKNTKSKELEKSLLNKISDTWCIEMIEHINRGDVENMRLQLKKISDEYNELKNIFYQYLEEYNYRDLLIILEGKIKHVNK